MSSRPSGRLFWFPARLAARAVRCHPFEMTSLASLLAYFIREGRGKMGDDRSVASARVRWRCSSADDLRLRSRHFATLFRSMTWDTQTFRRLEASALGLFELLELEAAGPQEAADDGAEQLLEQWTQRLFPQGSRELLEARLSWDGLDGFEVARRLAARPVEVDRTWTLDLEQSLTDSVAVADELRSGPLPEASLFDDEAPPFYQLWVGVVRWAARALDGSPVSLAPAAMAALQAQLLRGLSSIGAMAVYELLEDRLRDESPIALMAELLDAELRPLLETYPVLGRQAMELATSWRAAHLEWLKRLDADFEELFRTYGAAERRVDSLGLGLSDRHGGGRQVVDVRLEGGLRLAYKPRDTRLEATWYRLLHWLSDRGLDACPSAPRVLERGHARTSGYATAYGPPPRQRLAYDHHRADDPRLRELRRQGARRRPPRADG